MRTKNNLQDLKKILLFYEYLYSDENHSIDFPVCGGQVQLQLTMDEDMNVWCKNLTLDTDPEDPHKLLSYNDMLQPQQILSIMDLQKELPPWRENTHFQNRYQEIGAEVAMIHTLNH